MKLKKEGRSPLKRDPKKPTMINTRPAETRRDLGSHRMVRRYFAKLQAQAATVNTESILRVTRTLQEAAKHDRNIFILGNGGSAATALHFANDLTVCCNGGSLKIKAISLAGNISAYSAAANDFGHNEVFARQLRSLLRPRDIVMAFSVSGASENCIRALSVGKGRGRNLPWYPRV